MDIPSDTRRIVCSDFDFSRVPYVPMHRRDARAPGDVLYGGVRLHRAGTEDLERVAQWLRQPHVHPALGFARPPERGWIRRSRLPDGTGTMESVEFLILRDTSGDAAVGFYLCYEARRSRCQEVDFALADTGIAVPVALLRAGKIALLTRLMAVCGAREVHWLRRKLDPVTGRYRKQGRYYVVDRRHFVATLRRLERHGSNRRMPAILGAR